MTEANAFFEEQASPKPNAAQHDPTIRLFWIMMVCHFLAWIVVCLLTQPNMPLDMVEMLYWGQQWELGYHKHPPLPAWLAAGAWSISGGHAWLMYVVSQLTIVATFWAVWQLAREGLSPWAALCSVVLLEGCYYCTYMINDINNTIITRPFWALSILFLYRALVREDSFKRNLNWCLAGAAIGLGMISKYYLGVLVLSMMAVPVVIPHTRATLKTAGPYLLTIVAALVFLPHFWWMIDNDFITIRYAFNRSDDHAGDASALNHIVSPIKFLLSQLGAVVPMVVLAWPMLRENRKQAPANSSNDFFRKYVSIVFLGPIVIYLLISNLTGASIRSMWGGPLFSFFGVLLFATYELPEQKKVWKIWRDSLFIGAIMLAALVVRNVVGPMYRGELSRVHFPGDSLATAVNEAWNSSHSEELKLVGGEMFIAASASVYSPQHIDVYAALSPEASPWLSDEKFNSLGGVIVWEIDGESESKIPLEEWLARFTNGEQLPSIELPSRAPGSQTVTIGMILVPPAQ